jgi:uncharacterized membrane protein YgcG
VLETAIVDPPARDAAEPGARLLAFAARLRRQHVRHAMLGSVARTMLLLAAPSIAVAWWLPPARLATAVVLAVAATVTVAFAWRRARTTADAVLLRTAEGAPALAAVGIVGDELATWLENRRHAAADAPMVGWLGRDVAARLPQLPEEAVARAGRRDLGRLRFLLPFVLLLLIVWLLAEWLAPPWRGALSGSGGSASAGGGAGDGGGEGGGGGGQGPGGTQPPQDPGEQSPDDPGERPPPPNEDPSEPTPEQKREPPAPEPPAPLLELPEQQRFVVPEYIGDGPTRRALMHAAELERTGAVRQPRPSGSGGEGDVPAPPPPTEETFTRAAEAAQRARHVPDEERAMVRRFFELLREAAK